MNKTSWRKTLRQVFEVKIAFQKFSNLISLLSMNLNKKKQNQCFQIIFHQILKKYFWETSKRFSVAFFLLQKVFVLLSKKMKKDSPFAKVKHLTLDIKVCFFNVNPKVVLLRFNKHHFSYLNFLLFLCYRETYHSKAWVNSDFLLFESARAWVKKPRFICGLNRIHLISKA